MRIGLLPVVFLLMAAGCGEKDTPDDSTPDPVDADQDGFSVDEDCDDDDPGVNPDAAELCDLVDQDCDGVVDEGSSSTLYEDLDGDGYGVDASTTEGCEVGDGWALAGGDCADDDELVNPGADELCDDAGVDEDCDGEVNEGDAADAGTWYPDVDGDGYGDEEAGVGSCEQPLEHIAQGGDCDDSEGGINPDADEICDDELDNNCDGVVNEDGAVDARLWYIDSDGDGFGDPNSAVISCVGPSGAVTDNTDCDDDAAAVNPSAAEVCGNQVDDDCDGTPSGCELRGLFDVEALYHGKVLGESGNDQLGYSLQQGFGDDGDDGFADLIGGARRNNSRTGAAYRMDGRTYQTNNFDVNASLANTRIIGAQGGELFAERMAFVGDVTGDGIDDVLAGSSAFEVGSNEPGAAYLFAGPLVSGSTSNAVATWFGEGDNDLAGYSLTGLGDVTGDGVGDLAIGAPGHDGTSGAVYLIHGPITTSSAQSTLSTADVKISGAGANAGVGWWIAGGADHNGDGIMDLLVGAPGADGAYSSAGGAWLYEGPLLSDQSALAFDYELYGYNTADFTGSCVDWAGDFNGDGHADIVIGAPDADQGADSTGSAYLVFGGITGDVHLFRDADVTFIGEARSDNAGTFVANAGDVDGDGAVDGGANSDLLIGAPDAGDGGRAYLIYGSTAWSGVVNLSGADAIIEGGATGDDLGSVAMGVGDFNGDGLGDFVLGAPLADDTSTNANGALYLILGQGF